MAAPVELTTDAQTTAHTWLNNPFVQPHQSRLWIADYNHLRWDNVQRPLYHIRMLAATIAFTALPFRSTVPLTPESAMRLEELLSNAVKQMYGAYIRHVPTAVLYRVLAYNRLFVPPVSMSPHGAGGPIPGLVVNDDLGIGVMFEFAGTNWIHAMEHEVYRRDVAARATYVQSGAAHALHNRLQTGGMSHLQYLVASFLSPRIRRGPAVPNTFWPTLSPGPLPAALPVPLLSPSEMRAQLARAQASARLKRRAEEDDSDDGSAKAAKHEDEKKDGSGAAMN